MCWGLWRAVPCYHTAMCHLDHRKQLGPATTGIPMYHLRCDAPADIRLMSSAPGHDRLLRAIMSHDRLYRPGGRRDPTEIAMPPYHTRGKIELRVLIIQIVRTGRAVVAWVCPLIPLVPPATVALRCRRRGLWRCRLGWCVGCYGWDLWGIYCNGMAEWQLALHWCTVWFKLASWTPSQMPAAIPPSHGPAFSIVSWACCGLGCVVTLMLPLGFAWRVNSIQGFQRRGFRQG